jgi:hypothetical protein
MIRFDVSKDCLPKIGKGPYGKNAKLDAGFNEERRKGLNIYLNILVNARIAIVDGKSSSVQFIRFVSPIQVSFALIHIWLVV